MTTAATASAIADRVRAAAPAVRVRRLGLCDYAPIWRAMREYTLTRTAASPDELWLLEHRPVYTLGVAARPAHLPRVPNGIPVVRTDRGGQITYHGPGQPVVYLLLDLRRRRLGVRELVRCMEQAAIELLAGYGVRAHARPEAPGVYVDEAKIAAVGLRVREGCCYHGIAFNADLDLAPFGVIDPCGYPGLRVTRARDLGIGEPAAALGERLLGILLERLS
jgi:lipoyl(octanoyl) transferase